MAITVAWGTRVILVPRADMTLIQTSPFEIRELDINTLRTALKDLEDDADGMSFVDTHRNIAPITVGGLTLGRILEIINGYTVTFENGQYGVNVVGGNSNVADVVNRNQVSVYSFNSAGLVQITSGSGLSAEQATQLREVHLVHGLDATRPLVVTQTSRRVPASGTEIDQSIDESGGAVTVQRQ